MAHGLLVVGIVVQGTDVAQLTAGNGACGRIGLAFHAREHAVADGLCREAAVDAEGLDGLRADHLPGFPTLQRLLSAVARGKGDGEQGEQEYNAVDYTAHFLMSNEELRSDK